MTVGTDDTAGRFQPMLPPRPRPSRKLKPLPKPRRGKVTAPKPKASKRP